jgi:tetratricopeptide (TPR) repeat protein
MLSHNDESVMSFLFGGPSPSPAPSAAAPAFVRNASETASLERERVAIGKAEEGKLDEAERLLSEAIEAHGAASALNNRAQVRQMLNKRSEAELDLRDAVALAEKRGDAVTARQAHCQLGILLRLRCEDEEAGEHFEVASQLGSALAREQAVLLNGTAKLCGEMVAMMFSELHRKNT